MVSLLSLDDVKPQKMRILWHHTKQVTEEIKVFYVSCRQETGPAALKSVEWEKALIRMKKETSVIFICSFYYYSALKQR